MELNKMQADELNEREKNILKYIVQQFIETANPVGSRYITKKYRLDLSPATVRNIMSDLEYSGYINHPHTSAGRVPTDKGYRFFVDSLINVPKLKSYEKEKIHRELENYSTETEELISIASKILSGITNQLACVLYPNYESGILEKIQLVSISSNKILVVVTIISGLIKTILLEIEQEVKETQLELVQSIINERISGLKLSEIRETFTERFKDVAPEGKPIISLFIQSVDKIFKDFSYDNKLIISGAKNLLTQPEFEDPSNIKSIIELIEDKEIIVHFLEKVPENSDKENVFISIGKENEDEKLEDYSLVSKEYKVGDVVGTLGIVGPKRMNYSKMISIVDYLASLMTNILTK